MQHLVLQTPSLRHLAAVKIATTLWSQSQILKETSESLRNLPELLVDNDDYEVTWEKIEERVSSEVWALSLPETCQTEMSNIIKPIGMEIISWCLYHNLHSYLFKFLDASLAENICWSKDGTVDYKKTALLMAKDERLSIKRRFEFSCLNCLEDEARQLIEFIPNQRIHKYIVEAVRYQEVNHRIFIAYFACTLSGDEELLLRLFEANSVLRGDSINNRLFQVALIKGSRAACEYFSEKVNLQKKPEVYFMLQYRGRPAPTCGFMYCLSLINLEMLRLVLPEFINCLLDRLLDWPMQSLCLEAAKRLWQLLDSDECAYVLSLVIYKIGVGFRDFDYTQLFRELWALSPVEHKQDFLNDIERLEDLIATKRTFFIKLVLTRAPSHLLKELVEDRYGAICSVMTDSRIISEAVLMELKEKAALKSLEDPDNMEKRSRSECISRLVDLVMESRMYRVPWSLHQCI